MVNYLPQDQAQHEPQGLNPDIQAQRDKRRYRQAKAEYDAEVERVNRENEATIVEAEELWHISHDNTKSLDQRFKDLNDLITKTNEENTAKNEETLKKAEAEYHITVTPNETQEERFDKVNQFIDSLNQKNAELNKQNEAKYKEMQKYGVYSIADVQWRYVPNITLEKSWYAPGVTEAARAKEYNRRLAPYAADIDYNNKMRALFGGKPAVTPPKVGRLSKTASDILSGKSAYNPKQASPLLKAQVEAYQSYNQYLKGGISQSQYYDKQNEVNLLLHPQAEYAYKPVAAESAAPKYQSPKYQQLVKSGASGSELNREMYHTNQFVGTEAQWKALTYAEDKQIREARIKSAGYRKQGNLEVQQKITLEQQRLNNFKSASETLQLTTKNVPVAAAPWKATGIDANAPKPAEKVWIKRANGKEALVSIASANKLIERGQATALNRGTFQGPEQQKEFQGPQEPFRGPYGDIEYSFGEQKLVPVKGPVGDLEHTFGSKPLSPTGQVLEPIMKGISDTQAELQSTQAGKVVNALVGAPLGVAKDILTGIASLDTLGTQTIGPLVTGKTPYAETKIPDTSLGLLIQGGMEGKQGDELLKQQKEYVQKYGAAGLVGEYSTFLIGGNPVKGITKVLPVKIQKVESAGLNVESKSVVVGYGTKTKPVISKVGSKIMKGEPKITEPIKLEAVTPKQIKRGIKLAADTTKYEQDLLTNPKVLEKVEGLAPGQVEKAANIKKIIELGSKSKDYVRNPLGEQPIENVKPGKETTSLFKNVATQESKVHKILPIPKKPTLGPLEGSLGQQPYMLEKYTRQAGDIDFHMNSFPEAARAARKTINAITPESGRTFVAAVSEETKSAKGYIREAGKKDEKFAEFLNPEETDVEGTLQVIEGNTIFGKKIPSQSSKVSLYEGEKPSLRAYSLQRQFLKKGESIFSLQKSDQGLVLEPFAPRKAKDISDFYAIGMTKAENLREAGLLKESEELTKELGIFKENYKEVNIDEFLAKKSFKEPATFGKDESLTTKLLEARPSPQAVKAGLVAKEKREQGYSESNNLVRKPRERFTSITSRESSIGIRRSTSSFVSRSGYTHSPVPSLASRSTGSPSLAGKSPSVIDQSVGSPSIGGKSPSVPSLTGKSPSTPSIAGKSPSTPSIAGKSPSTPSIIGKSPSVPSLTGKSPGSPSIRGKARPPSLSSRTGSPGGYSSATSSEITTPRKKPKYSFVWNPEEVTDTDKGKPKPRADFLGSAYEASITGLAKRGDITYGRSRTARITAKDTRMITKGKAWSLSRGKSRMSTWTKPPEKVYQKFTGGTITGRKAFKKGLLF